MRKMRREVTRQFGLSGCRPRSAVLRRIGEEDRGNLYDSAELIKGVNPPKEMRASVREGSRELGYAQFANLGR